MKLIEEPSVKSKLTEEQYNIMVLKSTEDPFSGKLLSNKKSGDYTCAFCGTKLFKSTTKFDSGSGWPSFYDVANNESVELDKDTTHGMERVEVTCKKCGAHLGHLFSDAYDQPTGMRYCINSASLEFKANDKQ